MFSCDCAFKVIVHTLTHVTKNNYNYDNAAEVKTSNLGADNYFHCFYNKFVWLKISRELV